MTYLFISVFTRLILRDLICRKKCKDFSKAHQRIYYLQLHILLESVQEDRSSSMVVHSATGNYINFGPIFLLINQTNFVTSVSASLKGTQFIHYSKEKNSNYMKNVLRIKYLLLYFFDYINSKYSNDITHISGHSWTKKYLLCNFRF